jgi:hypothetical protein
VECGGPFAFPRVEQAGQCGDRGDRTKGAAAFSFTFD